MRFQSKNKCLTFWRWKFIRHNLKNPIPETGSLPIIGQLEIHSTLHKILNRIYKKGFFYTTFDIFSDSIRCRTVCVRGINFPTTTGAAIPELKQEKIVDDLWQFTGHSIEKLLRSATIWSDLLLAKEQSLITTGCTLPLFRQQHIIGVDVVVACV